MSKEEIFNIIYEKKAHKIPLTEAEKIEALKHFREDEINGFCVIECRCNRHSLEPLISNIQVRR